MAAKARSVARSKPKPKAKAKPAHNFNHKIASRADLQYLTAFLAGALVPFAGGALAAIISSSLWSHVVTSQSQSLPNVVLVNGITYTTMVLVVMAGMAALILAFRRFGVRVGFRGVTFSTLLVGALAFCVIALSYELYAIWPGRGPNPDLSVDLDIATVVAFGLAYVLGWWLARRYAKLEA